MHTKRNGTGCILLAVICTFLLLLNPGWTAQAREGGNATRLTLEEAYQRALEHNRNIASSRENVVQARKDVDEASSRLYPQLSARGEYTRQKELQEDRTSPVTGETIPGTPEEYSTVSLQLDQHLYQWGKVWSGREAAREYLQSSRAGHERRVQEILFRVASRYYQVLLGRRGVEIAENAVKLAEAQLDRARQRLEVGVVTRSDVLRAEVQLANAEEQLERARNDYQIAREELALEIGATEMPSRLSEPEKDRFSGDRTVEDLYSTALDNRRDLDRLNNRIQALQAQKSAEKADYYPELSAHGTYTRTDEPQIFQDNHANWEASLRLTYPLFLGGRDKAQLEKARSELAQALASRRRLKREIRKEVRSVVLDLRTQSRVIRQLEKQVQSARSNYEQVTAQFEQGVASSVDQVDAFTALNEAENRLAQSRYSYQLDLVRLELVTGAFQKKLVTGKERP